MGRGSRSGVGAAAGGEALCRIDPAEVTMPEPQFPRLYKGVIVLIVAHEVQRWVWG